MFYVGFQKEVFLIHRFELRCAYGKLVTHQHYQKPPSIFQGGFAFLKSILELIRLLKRGRIQCPGQLPDLILGATLTLNADYMH